jgi:TonB family protein
MMSGYKGRNKRADAHRVGATSIFEKPFSDEVLEAEIAAALGQGPAPDVSAAKPRSSEASGPLLSATDIFSDIVSGIETPAPGAGASGTPGTSEGTAPPGGAFVTLKVNVAEVAALAAATSEKPPEKAAERPAERPKKSGSASVDDLLRDTLSGLKIRPRSASTGTTDPGLPMPAPPGPAPAPVRPAAVTPPVADRPPATDAAPVKPAAPSVPAPRAPRPVSGPGSFGRYQLLERIASGGMADVFKARMVGEEGFEKIVAIKRILPHLATNEGFITMFVDEAKLAAQLTHNNIIQIYELGKVDAWHYIAMEYVDGKDLRSIVKMGRDRAFPLPDALALFIAARIASALDYAHRRAAPDGHELHLVHRDVSPQNILISSEGDIKLCDFGVAKAATKVSTTISGALKGKLQYMSPEQAWGKAIDRRSDIFSLGAVLFEMLTGQQLFEGENDLVVLDKVRAAEVVAPSTLVPEIPPEIDAIVRKALAREPQNRYENASDLEKELSSILYGYQPSPGPADLAIYLHRLLETPPAATDEDIETAFTAAQRFHEAAPQKGKGLVRTTRTSGEHLAPVLSAPPEPKPVPKSASPIRVAESVAALDAGPGSKKSRSGLIAGIGIAAALLLAVGFFVLRGRGGAAPEAPKAALPSPAAPATPETAAPAPEAPRIVDPKLVEAEAKRLAAETEKMRREAGKKSGTPPPGAGAAPPGVSLASRGAIEPPKNAEAAPARPTPQPVATSEPPAVRPAPTEAPRPTATAVPPPAAPAAPAPAVPASSGPVAEGDLVGPGEGVVDPKIVRMGSFSGLPPQAAQLARSAPDGTLGTCIIMALIDETGAVKEMRVIKSAAYKFADEAAQRALRGARITPPTKDGVKVKMWSTFAVTVKP